MMPHADRPTVEVVVPVHNEERDLYDLTSASSTQTA
jgi:hypothetical protein